MGIDVSTRDPQPLLRDLQQLVQRRTILHFLREEIFPKTGRSSAIRLTDQLPHHKSCRFSGSQGIEVYLPGLPLPNIMDRLRGFSIGRADFHCSRAVFSGRPSQSILQNSRILRRSASAWPCFECEKCGICGKWGRGVRPFSQFRSSRSMDLGIDLPPVALTTTRHG